MRKVYLGVIAMIMMAGSVAGFLYFMKKVEIETTTMDTYKPTRLLKSGEVVDDSKIRKVTVPVLSHSSEALSDIEQIRGKTVLIPMSENEEFVPWKLAGARTTPLKDERFYSFKVDAETNVNNMIRKGDRVDVWADFPKAQSIVLKDGTTWSLGAVKIIEGLIVKGVRTAEGLEVSDASAGGVFTSNLQQIANSREQSNGKPDLNTYIMNDDIYGAYVLGGLVGKIKLGLPDLQISDETPTKVTETYTKLKEALLADPNNSKGIKVEGDLKESDIKGVKTEKTDEGSKPVAKEVTH